MEPRRNTPQKPRASVFKKFVQVTPDPDTNLEFIDNLSDIVIEEWRLKAVKLTPERDVPIEVTIKNLTNKDINCTSQEMALRSVRDGFFQNFAGPVKKTIPAFGEVRVQILLKVNGGVNNLNELPSSKEIFLIKPHQGKMAKIASINIVIPIDPYIRHLKEDFAHEFKVLLCGLFGSGKSSFINSVATLFNEDPRFPKRKLSPAFVRPAGTSVSLDLHSYTFNNINLWDTWGWESGRPQVWSDLLFQLILGGRLPDRFKIDDASSINVLNLPEQKGGCKKFEMVLFFLPYSAADDERYITQLDKFIGEARKLDIPFLILLTQVDKVDPALKKDPYIENPSIQEIVSTVCNKVQLEESLVIPVINYTAERERNWAMDRATFVTLFSAFQRREEFNM